MFDFVSNRNAIIDKQNGKAIIVMVINWILE